MQIALNPISLELAKVPNYKPASCVSGQTVKIDSNPIIRPLMLGLRTGSLDPANTDLPSLLHHQSLMDPIFCAQKFTTFKRMFMKGVYIS